MKKSINNIHDKGYKDLYSNKDVFLNLVKDTLDYDWAKEIKPSDLILVDKSYILPNYHDKESDIVYRGKLGDEEVIFFVLLEFQSTVDYSMPIRLFFYISEILRREIDPKIIKDKKKSIKIPAVVPIVLYNGRKTWDAETSFRKIVDKEEMFSPGLLDFTYEIIDINNNYSKEELLKLKSVTGAIFLLDQKINNEEFLDRIKLIALTFDNMSSSERNSLLHWITQTTEEPIAKSSKEILLADKKEVVKVVANNSNMIKEMEENAKEIGKEIGKEVGKLEGIIEAIIENLNDIGTISEKLINEIKSQSDMSILKRWNKVSARSNSIEEFIENR